MVGVAGKYFLFLFSFLSLKRRQKRVFRSCFDPSESRGGLSTLARRGGSIMDNDDNNICNNIKLTAGAYHIIVWHVVKIVVVYDKVCCCCCCCSCRMRASFEW